MFLSLATLSKYDFNKRRLTEADFFEICATRKIEVKELDVVTSFYISLLGHEVIVIDKKLTGVQRDFALFHELSHALLGAGSLHPQALFMGMCDTKEEHEADAFACIALIPQSHLSDTSFLENCCCGFAEIIYRKRRILYSQYQL